MNYLTDTQASINKFAELNTEKAQEFAAKLGQQLQNCFDSKWDDKAELEQYIFSDKDVLESVCSEEEADFDWNNARDLQRDVLNAVAEFYNLA